MEILKSQIIPGAADSNPMFLKDAEQNQHHADAANTDRMITVNFELPIGVGGTSAPHIELLKREFLRASEKIY